MFISSNHAKSGSPIILGLFVFIASLFNLEFAFADEALTLVSAKPIRTHKVLITGFTFEPKTLTVNVGDRILWINKDFTPHNISKFKQSNNKLNNDAQQLSPNLMEKERFTLVVEKSFDYFCGLHPSMQGTVKIER